MALRVAVASSGGRDSTALLHCTVRQAAALGIEVHALHVHHGLVDHADSWQAQVRLQSRRWGARFDSRRLAGSPAHGESIEAWARRGRYQALSDMAHAAGCGIVLLAQHRRDQAETWLLQALRGAGPTGLASMPRSIERDGLRWVRPWLGRPREAIEAYLLRHRLRYADDASNDDERYARNRLRAQVWPALVQAFPDAEAALHRAARHAAQGRALAGEVAAADLPLLLSGDALRVDAWQRLPAARRLNALQCWLHAQLPQRLPDSLLERLMDELPRSRVARWSAPGAELRLYRGALRVCRDPGTESNARLEARLERCQRIDLSTAASIRLEGWDGCLERVATQSRGLALALLSDLQARPRRGGERFRLGPRATARSLARQFQACAVPAWARSGPLLYGPQGQLLFVPGLGVDGAAWAAEGQPQWQIRWRADGGVADTPADAPADTHRGGEGADR